MTIKTLCCLVLLTSVATVSCTPMLSKRVPCSDEAPFGELEIGKFSCKTMQVFYQACTSQGSTYRTEVEVPLQPMHLIRSPQRRITHRPFTMYFTESRGDVEFLLLATPGRGDPRPPASSQAIVESWTVPKARALPDTLPEGKSTAYFMTVGADDERTLYRQERGLPRFEWRSLGSCEPDGGGGEPSVVMKTTEIPFTIEAEHSVPFQLFNVLVPGPVTISVEWDGPSDQLRAVLSGRRRPALPDPASPYDETAGGSALSLSYEVTDADLARGVGWRLALYDMTGNGSAQGVMRITYPYDASLDSAFQKEKVSLRSGDHWPSAYLHAKFVDELQASPFDRKHGIISLSRPITCETRWHVEQQQIRLLTPLPHQRSYGAIRKDSSLGAAGLGGLLQSVTPLDPEDKIDPHILLRNYARYRIEQVEEDMPKNYVLDSSGKIWVSVLFSEDVSYQRVKQVASASACELESKGDHYYVGMCDADEIVVLAENDEIEWIAPGPAPPLITNDNTRTFMHVEDVQDAQKNVVGDVVVVGGWPNYNGLTGNGVNIAICDNGVDATHDDLAPNIVADDTSRSAAHGTHVAGIAAGNGVRSDQNDINGNPNNGSPFQYRGMAPEAGIIDDYFSVSDLDRLSKHIQDNSMDLSTHSHVFGIVGDYGAKERLVDQAVRGGASYDGAPIPRKPSIGTSANNGRDNPQYGSLRGYYSILNQAKNALILGNWDSGATTLSNGSSMGPTHDGRIKPDVVAPGTSIRSTATGANEVQYVSIENGTPTTGTFQLTFNGATTANIDFDADHATVRARLEALATIPAGDLDSWGGPLPGDRVGVTFENSFAGTDVATMTAAAAGLDNGATVQVAVGRNGHDDRHGYTFKSGTSMAAPATAGVYALMLEAWQNTYSTPLGSNISDRPPYPSTLRALIVQTARDEDAANVRTAASADIDSDNNPANGNDGLGIPSATAGPDFATGWGNVDALAVVELIQDSRTVNGLPVPNRIVQDAVSQGVQKEYDFVVDAAGPLRVTLAWDDKEGAVQSPGTSPTLVNDLDLELIAPDNTVYYPWQLGQYITDSNGNALTDAQQVPGTAIVVTPAIAAGNPSNVDEYVHANDIAGAGVWVATEGRDHLNNVEQVFVQNVPAAQVGHWKARVSGFNVPEAYQDFSLVGFPYPDLPDLEVICDDRVTIDGFGTNLTFTWSVENNGAAPTGSSFSHRILLSGDAFLGDDVVLNDVNQAMLGPLGVDGSVSHTSTIQISQANADALLGAGTTVDELLENDVFILIDVDHANAVLEHKETNIAVAQVARVADVVLVFDRSGSMSGMVPVSSGEQRKIDVLKSSANLFLDLMRLDANDRLAQVSFSGDLGAQSITVDFGPTDQLTLIGAGNIGDARDAIDDALRPEGSTDIRGALQKAFDVMTAGAGAGRRKAIIFFSDGKKTAGGDPSEAAFLQQFATNEIHVYSVGYGTVGGDAYTGIDVPLLQQLAATTDDGFFHVTEDALGLDKFFVNAVAGATSSEIIHDPVGTLDPGESRVLEVPVNRQDYASTFIVTWDTPTGELDLSLTSPEGVTINQANVGLFQGRVTAIERRSYKLLRVEYPLRTGASEEHAGRWKMSVSNRAPHPMRYSFSAMSESSIHMSMNLALPSSGSYWAPGTAIPIDIRLVEDDELPVRTANVVVTANVPLINPGDFLSSVGLTPRQIAETPKETKGDPLSIEERMMLFLRKEHGNLPPFRKNLPPIALQRSEKSGAFGGRFPKTEIEGYYQFTAVASGIAQCDPFRRETVRGFAVGMKIAKDETDVQIVPAAPGREEGGVTVTVTPSTVGGSLVGPGRAGAVSISAEGFLQPTSVLTDNLDGSYSQSFVASKAKSGTIWVAFGDAEVARIPLTLDVPTIESIVPASVTVGREQRVTIKVSGGPVSDVTGVVIASGPRATSLKDLRRDSGSNALTVSIPRHSQPGSYRVYLERAGYRGPRSPSGYLRIIDGQAPQAVRAFNGRLEMLNKAENRVQSIQLIGSMLRDLRDAAARGEISTEARSERLKALLRALASKQGWRAVDISPLN